MKLVLLQNVCMTNTNEILTLAVFAMLGMLSPASRGALMTAGIFLFMFMG